MDFSIKKCYNRLYIVLNNTEYTNTDFFVKSEYHEFPDNFVNQIELEAFSVDELLNGPIHIQDQPYSRDILSPTPIDPFGLVTNSSHYPGGALHHMDGLFTERLYDLGVQLPSYHQEAIEAEIVASHEFQILKNSNSILRLREKYIQNSSSISVKQARAIYLERICQGSSEQRLRIVAEHNEVESIEDMKMTAPLDEVKVLLGLQQYYENLQAIATKNDIDIQFLPANQQPIRMVDVEKTAHPGTVVTKRTIAVANVNDKIIDLKQKDSYVCLPTDMDLGSAVPVIRSINGLDVNIQHVAVSAYWAVRPPEV